MGGVLLITLVVTLVVLLLVLAVVAFTPPFALTRPSPERLTATAADGWPLAVHYRAATPRRFAEPIVLCHGLANNHLLFEFQPPQNLAMALSEAGFDCYSVDLRGAGASRPVKRPADVSFDDHVRLDVPAVRALIEAHRGPGKLIWLGHSLGGLLGLAAATTTLEGHLQALVTIGSPVFFPGQRQVRLLLRLAQWLSPRGAFHSQALRHIAPFAGRLNAKRLVRASANLDNLTPQSQRQLLSNVFAPMWRGVLRQLETWTREDSFRAADGSVDYRRALTQLSLPVLVVGGTVDGLAPEAVTRMYFTALTAPDKTLRVFGRSGGQHEDYGHGDLVVGKHAAVEVYPVLLEFLVRVASASVTAPSTDTDSRTAAPSPTGS